MDNFIAFVQIYSLLHFSLALFLSSINGGRSLVHFCQLFIISSILLSIVIWPEYIFRG